MFVYIGCYVCSYGLIWNGMFLCVGEFILGDYLCDVGVCVVLVGKIYMIVDVEGMVWLGIDLVSEIGVCYVECGFEVFEWDDGLYFDSLC